MNHLLDDVVDLAAPRDAVWRVIDDPAALGRVLPGCEELVPDGPQRYRATMRTRLQFITLRVAGSAELKDVRRPDHLRLEIAGRALGFAGGLVVSVPIDLEERDGGRTRATYGVELQLSGRLAAFGAPILRAAVTAQVRELVVNLERELAADTRGGAVSPEPARERA